MELMELKSAWKLLEQDVISKDKVEKDRIFTSVHGKSKSAISKIKRGLHTKFIVASITIILTTALAFLSVLKPAANPLDFTFSPLESAVFLGLMALTLAATVYFNFRAYSQMVTLESSVMNLKENLQNVIGAMKYAIAFNIYSDTFITPIIVTWVYYAYAFQDHAPDADFRTLLLFVLPVMVGVLSYLLGSFVQQLKFGEYLHRLGGYLDSLQKRPQVM